MKTRRIAIFGCSHSDSHFQEDESDRGSWAYELSKTNSNWIFFNHALGGSCLNYSTQRFMQYKEKFPNDFIIFQITYPFRLTLPVNEYEDRFDYDQLSDNYYKSTVNQKTFLTYGLWCNDEKNTRNKPKEVVNYYKSHLRYFPEKYEQMIRHCQIDYLQKNVDFLFFHTEWFDGFDKVGNIDVFQNNFTQAEWKNMLCDDDNHLNHKGAILEAEWVLNKIRQKIN